MQLFSETYKKMLLDLLNCNKPIIGTIFMNPYEWLDEFKKNKNIKLIDITFDNRDKIPLDIVELVSKNDNELQRKITKAKQYSQEQERFKVFDNKIVANTNHGVRTIKKDNDKYICDCEFYNKNNTCSHIITIINNNLI